MVYQGNPGPVPHTICHSFDDSVAAQHVLRFQLSGKLPEHTVLDSDGRILEDRLVYIQDFAIEDIPLGHVFTKNTLYTHDHNGTSQPVSQTFHGVMGCNGHADLKFTTPVYLWFLENN